MELRWRNGDLNHLAPGPEYGQKCVDSDMPGVNGSVVIGKPGRNAVTSSIWVYEWDDDDSAEDGLDLSVVDVMAEALMTLSGFGEAGHFSVQQERAGVEMLLGGDAALATLLRAAELEKREAVRYRLVGHAIRHIGYM